MLTLSYGFQKPEDTDTSDLWFPAMELNAQLLNDHNHDGVNSAPLASRTITALASNWVNQGGGDYNQLLTMPVGLTYDAAGIWVRKTDGEQVYLKLTRASATTFYLWTTDNTASYTVYCR